MKPCPTARATIDAIQEKRGFDIKWEEKHDVLIGRSPSLSTVFDIFTTADTLCFQGKDPWIGAKAVHEEIGIRLQMPADQQPQPAPPPPPPAEPPDPEAAEEEQPPPPPMPRCLICAPPLIGTCPELFCGLPFCDEHGTEHIQKTGHAIERTPPQEPRVQPEAPDTRAHRAVTFPTQCLGALEQNGAQVLTQITTATSTTSNIVHHSADPTRTTITFSGTREAVEEACQSIEAVIADFQTSEEQRER